MMAYLVWCCHSWPCRIYSSLSVLICSCKKPRAWRNSCIIVPCRKHKLASDNGCFPPTRPIFEKHLKKQSKILKTSTHLQATKKNKNYYWGKEEEAFENTSCTRHHPIQRVSSGRCVYPPLLWNDLIHLRHWLKHLIIPDKLMSRPPFEHYDTSTTACQTFLGNLFW